MPATLPSQYDEFAWFYHKYWGSGPNVFAVRIWPVMQERFLPLVRAGGRILDVCCGSGRPAQVLTGHRYHVTRVEGIAALPESGHAVAPHANAIHEDARTTRTPPPLAGGPSLRDSLKPRRDTG